LLLLLFVVACESLNASECFGDVMCFTLHLLMLLPSCFRCCQIGYDIFVAVCTVQSLIWLVVM